VLLRFTALGLGKALQESARVSRRPQQVCGLFQRFVVLTGEQDGITSARRDLQGDPVIVDLLDEREELLAGFGRSDRHDFLLWYEIPYQGSSECKETEP